MWSKSSEIFYLVVSPSGQYKAYINKPYAALAEAARVRGFVTVYGKTIWSAEYGD
jgi:hypothetical protein